MTTGRILDAFAFATLIATSIATVACGGGSTEPSAPALPAPPTAVADPVPPPRDDGKLPDGARPTSYRVELTVDPKLATFRGKATIEIEIDVPTRALVMHGRELGVTTSSVTPRAGKKAWAEASLRKGAHTVGEPEELVLVLDREVPAGPATVELEYEAPFASGLRGLYRVQEESNWYAFTQFEPNDARRAFPCFDEPARKVPFELAVTVPVGEIAVSNMPEVARRENPRAGLVTFEFEKSPPLPTYLVALGVGPLEVLEGAGERPPIRLVSAKGKSKLGRLALEAAREQLGLLERYFGSPYPYAKLDIVAVPNFAAGAMENPGFVTFREELVLLDPERASASARRGLAGVMAHELAHMWFGNLVTMSWWDDLWLNEGFATWMATKTVDEWRPSLGAGLASLSRKAFVMQSDSLQSARQIRQPVRSTSEALEAFDGITYVKGQAVIAMIEQWIGRERFRQGVRDYIAAHEWKNATAADLFAALGKAGGQDVGAVMATFTSQTGVPVVVAEPGPCRKGGATAARPTDPPPGMTITLTQREHRPLTLRSRKATSDKRWRFPVCVRYPTPGGTATRCELLSGERTEIGVQGCPKWIHPNASTAGYYHFLLSPKQLEALIAAAPKQLDAKERVGLISNAWALVQSGDLGVDRYLEIAAAFSAATERAVWEQIAEALGAVGRDMVGEGDRVAFRRYVVRVFSPAAGRLGWVGKADESEDQKLGRQVVLTALGSLGRHRPTLDQAREHANKWRADPASVPSDVAAIAIPLAAADGDAKMLAALSTRLKAAKTPEERIIALSGLASFDDPDLLSKVLDMTLDGTVKIQDLRYVFGPMFADNKSRDIAYPWVQRNFDALSKRLPSFVVGRFVWAAASLCDANMVEEAQSFFEPKLAQIEGAAKHLRQAIEAGRLCAARRERHAPLVHAFLTKRR